MAATSGLVVAAVLAAAVLHAAWNAIAHAITDQLVGFALIGIAATAGGALLAAGAPAPDRASWPYLAASGLLHTAYNLLLLRSYRLGEFGQMYPLARGTAPLVVAVAAAVFAGEALPGTGLAGVLLISVGLGVLVLAGGRPSRAQRPALLAAVGTGLCIAAYTTVDGIGVRHAGTAAGYAGWLFLLEGPVLPVIAVLARRGRLVRLLRPRVVTAGLLGGTLSMLAYALVLWAQTRGALAAIAALRETSVIFGAVVGATLFGEPFGRRRFLATVLVAGGVLLISL